MDCLYYLNVNLQIFLNKIQMNSFIDYSTRLIINEPVTNDNDENMTTKNDVEYLSALAKCGNVSFVSRYRRMHCANRNHAGNIATIGRIKYEPSTHDSTSVKVSNFLVE